MDLHRDGDGQLAILAAGTNSHLGEIGDVLGTTTIGASEHSAMATTLAAIGGVAFCGTLVCEFVVVGVVARLGEELAGFTTEADFVGGVISQG